MPPSQRHGAAFVRSTNARMQGLGGGFAVITVTHTDRSLKWMRPPSLAILGYWDLAHPWVLGPGQKKSPLDAGTAGSDGHRGGGESPVSKTAQMSLHP